MKLTIYKAEREAGLEAALRANRSVALVAEWAVAEPRTGELERAQRAAAGYGIATNLGQPDLQYLQSVLVTAGLEVDTSRKVPYGMNANDDVFDAQEVWQARATPEDKPVNDEHDCKKVIGHITSNVPVGPDGALLPDDMPPEELPGRYHLVTGSVIYKVWSDPDMQALVDTLLEEAARGERKVSMECLFNGFDYCLVGASGARVVARSSKTAHLTKHLRAYGGSGNYQGERVGRILRDLVFSGKGIVKDPANPASVILSSSSASVSVPLGYENSDAGPSTEEKLTPMNEIEKLQAQLAELRADNEKLKHGQAEEARAKLVAELEEATARAKALEASTAQLSEQLKQAEANAAEQAKQLTEAHAARDQALSSLRELSLAAQRRDRLEAVKAKLDLPDEQAVAFVDAGAALSDEQFTAQLTAVAVKVQKPPKSTPAPSAPQSTNLPAPAKASADDLDGAEPEAPAALGVTVEPDADSVRLAIAKFYGYQPK